MPLPNAGALLLHLSRRPLLRPGRETNDGVFPPRHLTQQLRQNPGFAETISQNEFRRIPSRFCSLNSSCMRRIQSVVHRHFSLRSLVLKPGLAVAQVDCSPFNTGHSLETLQIFTKSEPSRCAAVQLSRPRDSVVFLPRQSHLVSLQLNMSE